MNSFNILFTSAGRRVALLHSFRDALNRLNLPGKIVVADCKKDIPACCVADFYELVPSVNSDNYVESLQEICQKHNINLLIPLIDSELFILSLQ